MPQVPRPELPEKIIRARGARLSLNFAELWRHRDLFLLLAWRDIIVRYKQAALGITWAVLQPVLTMVVFTVLFGKLAKFSSGDAPYAVMIFAALLPWQLFTSALSDSSNSVVGSSGMVSKVYFPRLLLPASSICSGLLDFAISLAVLAVLMWWYRVPVHPQILLLPVFTFAACLAALAFGLWLSALNVRYRDVKYIVPFFTRIGLYVSPVGFSSFMVLKRFGPNAHLLYSLNPMVGVIDGFRWCILGPAFQPDGRSLLVGGLLTAAVLLSGAIYFRRTESTFADVI